MALLEVAVAQAADVAGCVEGGADRLTLAVGGPVGLAPDLALASSVIRESDLPVRPVLRLREDHTTSGGEFVRLVGLAEEYLALGAEGVAFGFLDRDLEVDRDTCAALAAALPGVPWTFHRAVDDALDPRRAWRDLLTLDGLTAVQTGGSPLGLARGYDDLLARCEADPRVAALAMPAGGLTAEMVPWLARAGVTQFHVGPQVRPGGSERAYVDAGFVRSWRSLLDGLVRHRLPGAAS